MSDLIIEGAKGIPDGLYVIKDSELFKYKPNGGTVRSYHITDRPKGECLLGTELALTKWIPCSERLPSEKKAVLICDSGGNCFVGKLILTDTGYKWKIPLFTVWMDIEDGDAWMPLPEAYKESDTK